MILPRLGIMLVAITSRGDASGIQGGEAKNAAKLATKCRGVPTTQRHPVQSVSSALLHGTWQEMEVLAVS